MGGTGAMGVPLVNGLRDLGHNVYVTSRRERKDEGNIHFLCGNAHNIDFITNIVKGNFDVIVDFMIYTPHELEVRLSIFLESTNQYIFISSSRVYAETAGLITEMSPRLLDCCKDIHYLKTDEYALSKAREENQFFKSGKSNWTIIRPYITFNNQRLQLGVYEKEHWLYRAMNGKCVVMPYDIAQKKTSFTYGEDVAKKMTGLVGNIQSYGEVFHIVTDECMTWGEICALYSKIYEELTGKELSIVYSENSNSLKKIWNKDQIQYDRLYDRVFDNSKIENITGNKGYTDLETGIRKSLSEFLESPHWESINWRYEGWADKQSREITPLSRISGLRMKLAYIKHRLVE